MGLALEVGFLADMLENDEDGAEWFETDIDKLNGFIKSQGLKPHEEPREFEVFSCQMHGYSGLHYLRRIAAHLDLKGKLPEPGDENASSDPVLEEYSDIVVKELGFLDKLMKKEKRKLSFDHLLLHSDAEGYYLPQDFAEVLFPPEDLEIPGCMVGSSNRLMEECKRIAEALELPLDMDPEAEEVWDASAIQGEGDKLWQKYGVESFSCLRLHYAAKLSVDSGAMLVFC